MKKKFTHTGMISCPRFGHDELQKKREPLRETKTQWIDMDGCRYRKTDGYMVGSTWIHRGPTLDLGTVMPDEKGEK